MIFLMLCPCDVFVVLDAAFEVAVEDTDEAVAELAERGAVAGAAGRGAGRGRRARLVRR